MLNNIKEIISAKKKNTLPTTIIKLELHQTKHAQLCLKTAARRLKLLRKRTLSLYITFVSWIIKISPAPIGDVFMSEIIK